ncbi:MAG: rRNA adenine N-6-methyltransferase family protein, partial [Hydrogenophilaceae bacterium]
MSEERYRHKKQLGQHFLHDPSYLARIVAAIRPEPDDLMVEIGPGQGALTRPLLDKLKHLHVVE